MQLAILHYHFDSGGVAQVVHNHLLAMAATEHSFLPERVLLVHGRSSTTLPLKEIASKVPFPVESVVMPELDYDTDGTPVNSRLGTEIGAMLREHGCSAEETLLHWHNHSLGKNVSVPLAVAELARSGYRTLLQIHDFAEDFRPANYRRLVEALGDGAPEVLAERLYPQAPHIHYATLNSRDFKILRKLGVAEESLRLLPNPVNPPPVFPDEVEANRAVRSNLNLSEECRLAVYPVRGIRRKNLGEMLLWSTLLEDTWFYVTLAPQNPVEQNSFEQWRRFAKEHKLNCLLGPPDGAAISFGQVLAASDVLITTSVAEGFGMAFLEAWLTGNALFGRPLAEITADFSQLGLDLDGLYDFLQIPSEWVDEATTIQKIQRLVTKTYEACGRTSPGEELIRQAVQRLLEPPTVDFARLPTMLQRQVISTVANSTQRQWRLLELNPKLRLPDIRNREKIRYNSGVVRREFSLAKLGADLLSGYQKLMTCKPTERLSPPQQGDAVFAAFLSLDRLHPLRVEQ